MLKKNGNSCCSMSRCCFSRVKQIDKEVYCLKCGERVYLLYNDRQYEVWKKYNR